MSKILDTVEGKAPDAAPQPKKGDHVSVDRFEVTRVFQEREEEEKVEAAAALYEKAARQWMNIGDQEEPEPSGEDSAELEAMSQELRLRQKCQDIAALIMADERDLLSGGSDEDEEK